MNVTREELIRALRCSKDPGSKCRRDCPYLCLEEVTPELLINPDLEENGVLYWTSCDCDRMTLDAAEMLEEDINETK